MRIATLKCVLSIAMSVLSVACNTVENTHHSEADRDDYNPIKLIVQDYSFTGPELEKLKTINSVTPEQLQELLADYASELSSKVESTIAISEDEQFYNFCGTIMETDAERLYRKGIKFRVVGVTEKWIPINGESKKVLHLKLAPQPSSNSY